MVEPSKPHPTMPQRRNARGLGGKCTRCTYFSAIGKSDPTYPGIDICKYCLECVNCSKNFEHHLPNGKCLFSPRSWEIK